MKSLSASSLSVVVNDLKSKIINNHISNIVTVNSSDIILSFSFYRKEKLFISINHECPFISLISKETSISSNLSSLSDALRKNIKDNLIHNVYTLNDDRVVEFCLYKTNELFEKETIYLVLELFAHSPNLLILDESRKIKYASHYTSITVNRPILFNDNYSLPEKKNFEIKQDDFVYPEYIKSAEAYILTSLTKKHDEKYSDLKALLLKKIKMNKNKNAVLEKEIKEAEKKLIFKEYGSNLLALQYNDALFEEYIREHEIEIDKRYSRIDNINLLFKKYKKAKRTIEMDNIQLAKTKDNKEELENDLALFNENNEESTSYLIVKYLGKHKKTSDTSSRMMPYYVTVNNIRFQFGKNNEQNDYLTFKLINNPNYYFFHLAGESGNHVIMMKEYPTVEELKLGAELAAALANKTSTDIHVLPLKEIKKGKFPGQVLMGKYQTYRVERIREDIKKTLESAKRLSKKI